MSDSSGPVAGRSDRAIATLDVGTTHVKAAVLDQRGSVLSLVSRSVSNVSADVASVEFSPEVALSWPLELLSEALELSGVPGNQIGGIGVTGARATVLAIDDEGREVGPLVAWTDRRGESEIRHLADAVGGPEEFYRRTGLPVDPSPAIAKILSVAAWNDPRQRGKLRFIGTQTAALHELTGKGWFVDETSASYFGVGSWRSRRWDVDLLAAAGIDESQLPVQVRAGHQVGGLGGSAAEALRLPVGVPVIAAGSDAAAMKVGAGALDQTHIVVSIGTAASAGVFRTPLPPHPPGHGLTYVPGLNGDVADISGLLPAGGDALRWLRDVLRSVRADLTYEELITQAWLAPPGSEGVQVLPWFKGRGETGQAEAGASIGGLRSGHGLSHLVRAFLEGICLAVRAIVEQLSGRTSVESVRFVGGLAHSADFAQLLADILARPVQVPESAEAALVGAAALTSVAINWYDDVPQALAAMVRLGPTLLPRSSTRETYDAAFACFCQSDDRIPSHTPNDERRMYG